MTTDALYLAFVTYGDVLHVLGANDGGMKHLRPIGCFTPDWDAVRAASRTIEALVRHAADSGELAVASFTELRRAGTYLFDELFPETAKRWLREHGGRPLLLNLPPDLLDVPWELVHTGDDFLSLQWSVGRLVQHDRDVRAARTVIDGVARSMLLVADPDGHLHEAYAEGEVLREGLSGHPSLAMTYRAADVDAAFVRRHVREYDILHFAGHIDARGWRMSESRFDADALRRLAGGGPMPAMVFANGCGATRADGLETSMLGLWLRGGVHHVLGPLFDLPDRLGRSFAVLFYDGLLQGETVGDAVRRARRRLAEDVGEGTTPWGAYVLYGDPSTRYFPRRRETRKQVNRPRTRPPVPTRLGPPSSPLEREVVRRSMTSSFPAAERSPRTRWASWAYVLVLLLVVALTASAALLVRSDANGARFDDRVAAPTAPVD